MLCSKLEELLSLCFVKCERFFTQHVLADGRTGQCLSQVPVDGRGDVDRVDIRIANQIGRVGVPTRDAEIAAELLEFVLPRTSPLVRLSDGASLQSYWWL